MIANLSITEITALLMVVFTFVIVIANTLDSWATRRTTALQIKSNYSVNHQSIVSGHRELFLGLLNRPDILEKFAEANGIDADAWELKIISAFFINHVLIHYLNFSNGTLDAGYLEGFKQDAQEIFTFPTVQSHWEQAKVTYSKNFQQFVEQELMSTSPASSPASPPVKA